MNYLLECDCVYVNRERWTESGGGAGAPRKKPSALPNWLASIWRAVERVRCRGGIHVTEIVLGAACTSAAATPTPTEFSTHSLRACSRAAIDRENSFLVLVIKWISFYLQCVPPMLQNSHQQKVSSTCAHVLCNMTMKVVHSSEEVVGGREGKRLTDEANEVHEPRRQQCGPQSYSIGVHEPSRWDKTRDD